MKDTCTISVKLPATSLLEDKGDTMIAFAKYGKGTVVAVVDPWLYNEYAGEGKTGPGQDNYAAGKEFVRWFLMQGQRGTGTAAMQLNIVPSTERVSGREALQGAL